MNADQQSLPEDADLAALGAGADSRFDVLSHARRRFVLVCLATYDDPLTLPDVADELAVFEYDARLPEISAEHVAAIRTDLYHVHVPRMADAGLVEYSQERELVALADAAEELVSHLDLPTIE